MRVVILVLILLFVRIGHTQDTSEIFTHAVEELPFQRVSKASIYFPEDLIPREMKGRVYISTIVNDSCRIIHYGLIKLWFEDSTGSNSVKYFNTRFTEKGLLGDKLSKVDYYPGYLRKIYLEIDKNFKQMKLINISKKPISKNNVYHVNFSFSIN